MLTGDNPLYQTPSRVLQNGDLAFRMVRTLLHGCPAIILISYRTPYSPVKCTLLTRQIAENVGNAMPNYKLVFGPLEKLESSPATSKRKVWLYTT